jgi:hypothetical protein
MQPRQVGIVAAAVIGAFVIAFAIGTATSGSPQATAGRAAKAEVIQAGDVSVTANAAAAATLPALKVVKKKQPAKQVTTSAPTTTAAPTTTSSPPTTTSSPPAQNTQPQQPANNGPVSTGGGED